MIEIIQLVERHYISKNNKYYDILDYYCFMSKNLYNFANYHIRQNFIKNGEYLNYNEIDKLMKIEENEKDYRNMVSSQSAQQCLKLLDKNWKSFFASIKDYNKHKDKYSGRPKLPKYLKKNGRNILIFTNQNCKIKNGYVYFPKKLNGFTIKTDLKSFQQVRVLSKGSKIIIEIVYNKETKKVKEDNGKYLSIDIGLDNLATITNNFGKPFIILNGRQIKSINQFYNKEMSHYRSIAKRMNKLDYTKKMDKLTNKRNNLIDNLIHKASRKVIDYTLSYGANTIVIGNNKDWKRNSNMSKEVNQKFIQIPHQKLIQQIQYKALLEGVNVIITEESYTSGTSFLDGELPIKENYNKNRRVHRGLFVSNKGVKINSDVNGSLQILKKAIPNAYSHGIEDFGLNPIRVNL